MNKSLREILLMLETQAGTIMMLDRGNTHHAYADSISDPVFRTEALDHMNSVSQSLARYYTLLGEAMQEATSDRSSPTEIASALSVIRQIESDIAPHLRSISESLTRAYFFA